MAYLGGKAWWGVVCEGVGLVGALCPADGCAGKRGGPRLAASVVLRRAFPLEWVVSLLSGGFPSGVGAFALEWVFTL